MRKLRILVLCTGNSARSQMAEGLLRRAYPGAEVYSAGTRPTQVRAEAVAVMAEAGIDISGHTSKSADSLRNLEFDWVITVCDNAAGDCPVYPGPARRQHWPFEDPAAVEGDEAARLEAFRKVRDQIELRIHHTPLEI